MNVYLFESKVKKTYEHLKSHDILSLPSIVTLDKYLTSTKGMYGFQTSTFSCLNEKSKHLKPEEKRGTLLIDEMKVSEQLIFDKKTLKVNGFTNLGEYTPLHQNNQEKTPCISVDVPTFSREMGSSFSLLFE
uniref:Transposable element P transposase-like RNase H domain-containing protein n=1 Tax=Schizaphis graminum TaxID=13262 RepID=A0A2S2P3I2_SCHGA